VTVIQLQVVIKCTAVSTKLVVDSNLEVGYVSCVTQHTCSTKHALMEHVNVLVVLVGN
jgi:hypothetical protein